MAVWQKQRNIATQTAENRLIERQAIFLPIGLWKGLTKYIWARYGWCSSYSTVAGGLKKINLLRLSKKEKISERLQKEEITSFRQSLTKGKLRGSEP